jgi:hypothetical protein
MSVPAELGNATALTRHKARKVHKALRDLEEFDSSMAYSQGVIVRFTQLSPRATQVIKSMGYEVCSIRYNEPGNKVSVKL